MIAPTQPSPSQDFKELLATGITTNKERTKRASDKLGFAKPTQQLHLHG
jgi:hypothetical protein